jgi:SAM-dependent methyltransferase
MGAPEFDFDEVFAPDDYLYFYHLRLSAERTEGEVELMWRLLGLEPGMAVLDLACGHGRIANRLAARGCQVVGLDASPGFLDVARRDAIALAHQGIIAPEYVLGDMRHLPWSERFDGLLTLRRGSSPTGSRFIPPAIAGSPRRRCPSHWMFNAAFRSRSTTSPQCVQTCVRTLRLL